MIYTALTKKAMKICFETHKDQVDKSGLPYVFHPFHLAEQMDNEYSVVVALLHDVVEDGEISLDELRRKFPSEIVDAIALMTHGANVDYFEYVKAIKSNDLACKVKLADLQHNSDRTRLNEITAKDELRYQKYQMAMEILRNKEQL